MDPSKDERGLRGPWIRATAPRHEADYDLSRSFVRSEVKELIADTRAAFQRWSAVRPLEAARPCLAALLTGERLRRRAF